MYQHLTVAGEPMPLPVTKAICVGRNYAAHAAELNNDVPAQPLLFIKPEVAFTPLNDGIKLYTMSEPVHYELELALLIGRDVPHTEDMPPAALIDAVAAVGLGVDLTLRQTQQQLAAAGQPWERAKGFVGALPMSTWVPVSAGIDLQHPLQFQFAINDELRQVGDTRNMIFPLTTLLREIQRRFSLRAGDVILTGTPAGVGTLAVGDKLLATLSQAQQQWQWQSDVTATESC